jgi:hypothetical protein
MELALATWGPTIIVEEDGLKYPSPRPLRVKQRI